MAIEVSGTERRIIAIYRGVDKKGKERIMDMLDVVMRHCMESSGSGNVYDIAEWKQKKGNGGGQGENQGYIHGKGAW